MLYPMATMVLLTLIVGIVAIKNRVACVRNKEVSIRYFKLMQGDDIPEAVIKSTRCFNNQFEIPVLFYVACTLHISLHVDSISGVILAWLFVGLRYLHAFIHLTYNHILHRILSFWSAFICVVVLWGNLLLNV